MVWGLFHGMFLTLETIFPKMIKKMGVFRHLYVLLVVCTGFVIFRADSMEQAGMLLEVMFTKPAWTVTIEAATAGACNLLFLVTLPVAVICSVPILEWMKGRQRMRPLLEGVSYMISIPLLLAWLVSLAGGIYNLFIYFRF